MLFVLACCLVSMLSHAKIGVRIDIVENVGQGDDSNRFAALHHKESVRIAMRKLRDDVLQIVTRPNNCKHNVN